MEKYDHKKVEKKWQDRWEKNSLHKANDSSKKKKTYLLVEFPYPSGDGLHTGHVRPYTGMDVIARKRRAEGEEVLFPIGWDAFGLPTENYAIKNSLQPKDVTKTNTDKFRRQIKSIGISFDWSREINTTDPEYYKWTQWIFLKLFEKGLAYKDTIPINWCLSCKIGLANEEVVDGKCERCGGDIEKRDKEQWMLAITKYAERLDKDLDDVDYIEPIKLGQRNWIGKSEGAELSFPIKDSDKKIDVFTTRPDTLYGTTYVVLAPEHQLVSELHDKIENTKEVLQYVEASAEKSEIERTAEGKEKTGVLLKGVSASNPANKKEIPIFIADYVLAHYGTGAIMAVPAHDERDYEFAKKYNLDITQVLVTCEDDSNNPPKKGLQEILRDTVVVHLKDKSTGKFAILEWHGSLQGITTAIMGGIEDGQTPEDAALAEMKEEAAITEAKIVKKAEWITVAKYCASHKKQNRCAVAHTFLAEVENLNSQGEISKNEQSLHTLIWVDEKNVLEKLVPKHQKQMWLMLRAKAPLLGEGFLMNSGQFDGISTKEARKKITKSVGGEMKTTFKLRDWVFSRQRYWGEPIPMIHCEKCALNDPVGQGWFPVREEDLPVLLPEIKKYKPTDDGESPLATISEFVNTKCPKCGGKAKRETDTMPNWAGSSWYYLRYTDPGNKKKFASKKMLKEWTPVDWYNGGMEHTTLHLLYSRFWHKFLYDEKLVPTDEPYSKRTAHGLILAEGGEKMSKSKGNVINPDDVVKNVGADTLRLYEMFMGPFDQAIPWSTDNMVGSRRFLERVWRAQELVKEKRRDTDDLLSLFHATIKKVGEDIEAMKFNTSVSSLMVLLNKIEEERAVSKGSYILFLQLLAPFAPHIASELHERIGESGRIHEMRWPKYDEKRLLKEFVTIVVQVNGKVRGTFEAPINATKKEILKRALLLPKVIEYVDGKNVAKSIHVVNKLLNIVI